MKDLCNKAKDKLLWCTGTWADLQYPSCFQNLCCCNNKKTIFLFSSWLVKLFHPLRLKTPNKNQKKQIPTKSRFHFPIYSCSNCCLILKFNKTLFQAKTLSKISLDLFVLLGKQLGFYNTKFKQWTPRRIIFRIKLMTDK